MKVSRSHGFTLVELMIVVAIIGVLAAIAIPVFQKYMVKTRVSEAPMMLRKIMDGATAYFTVDHTNAAGQNLTPQFPATTGWYPAQLPRGTKVQPGAGDPPDADKESWNQLRFSINEPIQFRYRFVATGNGVTSRADIAAESELVSGIVCRMERAAWTKGGNTLELQFSDLKIVTPPF